MSPVWLMPVTAENVAVGTPVMLPNVAHMDTTIAALWRQYPDADRVECWEDGIVRATVRRETAMTTTKGATA